MRRNVYKQFVMNRKEAEDLARKAEGACMSEGRLIRMLVAGYVPPPVPGDQFHEEMQQILQFTQRLQQIAAGISDDELKEQLADEIRQWKDFRMAMQRQYLQREESKYQWL